MSQALRLLAVALLGCACAGAGVVDVNSRSDIDPKLLGNDCTSIRLGDLGVIPVGNVTFYLPDLHFDSNSAQVRITNYCAKSNLELRSTTLEACTVGGLSHAPPLLAAGDPSDPLSTVWLHCRAAPDGAQVCPHGIDVVLSQRCFLPHKR